MYIVSPPTPDDIIRRYFTVPYIAFIRELHIFITAGGHLYTTRQQCTEVVEYLQNIISMVSSANNLQLTELDLFAFTPGDCTPNLWPFLQLANDQLIVLVRTIVTKRPELHIRLSRPDIMAEAQVEITSRPVFEAIINAARGRFQSLSIGCRLNWLLRWIRNNPQLREIYYTKTLSESHEIEEFWEVIQLCRLDMLMLGGFDFPPVQRIPVGLTELILTLLDDTVDATNAILTHLPNLRVLSLRLERRNDHVEGEMPQCVGGEAIVCRGLRKAWWTRSFAPETTVAVLSRTCTSLDSLSPPRNVTDQDLVFMSESAIWLTEVWMMDCPNITESGFRSLKHLKRLKCLQIHTRFATFLNEELMADFLQLCNTLAQLTIVFDGASNETTRREELLANIPGKEEYHVILSRAMSFQSSNLGDRIIIDIQFIRNAIS